MSKSEEKTDFWGDKYTVHYDDDGEKIGESREKTDFWGDSYTEHTDSSGNKTGESRDKTDFWGDSYTEHTDSSGDKTGESRDKTDFWGDDYTEHTDSSGSKTGESREKRDFWGDRYTEHEGSGARGSSGSSSSSSGSSSGGSSSSSSSGCCFTATACLRARNLPDNCFELEELRRFRDQHVRLRPGGAQLIDDYYRWSPLIVSRIEQQPQAIQVFEEIYSDVKEAVSLIGQGRFDEAFDFYFRVFEGLRLRFACC